VWREEYIDPAAEAARRERGAERSARRGGEGEEEGRERKRRRKGAARGGRSSRREGGLEAAGEAASLWKECWSARLDRPYWRQRAPRRAASTARAVVYACSRWRVNVGDQGVLVDNAARAAPDQAG